MLSKLKDILVIITWVKVKTKIIKSEDGNKRIRSIDLKTI